MSSYKVWKSVFFKNICIFNKIELWMSKTLESNLFCPISKNFGTLNKTLPDKISRAPEKRHFFSSWIEKQGRFGQHRGTSKVLETGYCFTTVPVVKDQLWYVIYLIDSLQIRFDSRFNLHASINKACGKKGNSIICT